MTEGLDKLYVYFGPVGIASIAGWALAAALLIACLCRVAGRRACRAALVLACAGWVLALFNSSSISKIQIDFTGELEAAKVRAEEMQEGPESRPASAPAKYSYRDRGKVEREAGSKIEDKTLQEYIEIEQDKDVRLMTQEEVAQANRFDRLNLLMARLLLIFSFAAVIINYLVRFNRTFDPPLALPLAGWCIDAISPKTRSVCIGAGQDGVLKEYLSRAVRKGETFIYFTGSDPWPDQSLQRWPSPIGSWRRLRKVVCETGGREFDAEFVLESAWFGRCCFVVTDAEIARALLNEMAEFLRTRHATRASARRTVNIAWDLSRPIPGAMLAELIKRCREANFKLLVRGDGPADLFEEIKTT
jgi:hypothetical protein